MSLITGTFLQLHVFNSAQEQRNNLLVFKLDAVAGPVQLRKTYENSEKRNNVQPGYNNEGHRQINGEIEANCTTVSSTPTTSVCVNLSMTELTSVQEITVTKNKCKGYPRTNKTIQKSYFNR